MTNIYIDCEFCQRHETETANEVYFKRSPNEVLVRCSRCNNLQVWK